MQSGKGKKISEKLSATFDNMDAINSAYLKIETIIIEEHNALQKRLNPDNDNEVSREINHYLLSCIKKLFQNVQPNNYENKV